MEESPDLPVKELSAETLQFMLERETLATSLTIAELVEQGDADVMAYIAEMARNAHLVFTAWPHPDDNEFHQFEMITNRIEEAANVIKIFCIPVEDRESGEALKESLPS